MINDKIRITDAGWSPSESRSRCSPPKITRAFSMRPAWTCCWSLSV